MKTSLRFAMAAALMVGSVHAADWTEVRSILGRQGEEDQGVLRISFERSDLKVTKGGVPVSADVVFDCWYGFWPLQDGSVMLMGDTCVREDELPAVEQEMDRQGLDLTALHNHLVGETPKVMFLHLSARGDPADLARKVKAVLARTATPTGKEKQEGKPKALDWTGVTSVLGEPSERHGDIIEYGYRRGEKLSMHGETLPSTDALETAPEVKFQLMGDGRAITYGEMILTANEVAPVFHVLVENGIEIDALHNHMTQEQPRLFFMHWRGVGEPRALASGVKAALAKVNVRPERENPSEKKAEGS